MSEEEKTLQTEQVFSAQELAQKEVSIYEQKMKEDYFYFVAICSCFAFCYVLGNYKIESGLGVFVATIGQMLCCLAAVKKWEIVLKKDTVFYVIMIVVMSAMMLWTSEYFLHFLQKKAILILFIVIMFHQMYEDTMWNLKTYIWNIFVLMIASVNSIFQPIEQFLFQFKKKQKDSEKGLYVLLGLGIAIPLVFVILAMLVSADVVFQNMVVKIIGNLLLPQNIIWIMLLFLFGFWIFYCFLAGLAKGGITEKKQKEYKKQADAVIAITFTSILLIIYVVFCVIQIRYLFLGGENHLPKGYTYSSYARKGFFELLFVSMINFILIVVCNMNFKKSKYLDKILTAISICNMILIASSAYRMMLYVAAYHLTVLRVFVLWFLAMLAVGMIGVIYAIYQKEYRLFRYIFTVGVIFLVGMSAIKPHSMIAKYNLSHIQWYHIEDLEYIMSLSLDVAPILAEIDTDRIVTENGESGQKIMEEYFLEVKQKCEKSDIRTYHIAVMQAKKAAEAYLKQS